MYMNVLSAHMSVYHMPTEVRRARWLLWNWSYRLRVTMWALEIEVRSSARAASAFDHRPISLALPFS